MINPKFIVGSAIAGFALSFFVGLFSGAGLLVILLRALVCAAGFAGVCIGILFVSGKYLFSPAADTGTADANGAAGRVPPPGRTVDITVSDETVPQAAKDPLKDIPSEQNAENRVGGQFQERGEVGRKDSSAAVGSVDPFEKVPLGSEEGGAAAADVVPADRTASRNDAASEVSERPAVQESGNGTDELDDLPDLDNLVSEESLSRKTDDNVIEDSDFAAGDAAPAGTPVQPAGQEPEIKDVPLITQAIRTVLAKDEQ